MTGRGWFRRRRVDAALARLPVGGTLAGAPGGEQATAPPPAHPDTARVETKTFTNVNGDDIDGWTVPPDTAAITIVAQGGAGGGGGSNITSGGGGGQSGATFAMHIDVGAGGQAIAGDTLLVQVG